jgi:hypothetical protein
MDPRQADHLRLHDALRLLGCTDITPAHHKAQLLDAIGMFAAVQGAEGLERACSDEILLIRAAITARDVLNRLATLATPAVQK